MPPEEAIEEQVRDDGHAREAIPDLFQFKRTYIAFEHADGLVRIAQHSAHERVLYEEFMTSL